MFKTIITKEKREEIELEYDNEKYNIEYFKPKNMIVLRRLSDNKILEIFSDKIGFIVQSNTDQGTSFLVTDYSAGNKDVKFKHYVDRNSSDSLELVNEFECNSTWLSDCRITNKSYLVEQSGYGGTMYNLDKKSRRFYHVYHDKKLGNLLGENTLLVSEKKSAYFKYEISDIITYGINPETFEITTPIWSELQQRLISVYTREQVEKLDAKLREECMRLNTEHYNFEEITIHFEIQKYLDMLEKYFDRPESVYLNGNEYHINEEFVKKFAKIK